MAEDLGVHRTEQLGEVRVQFGVVDPDPVQRIGANDLIGSVEKDTGRTDFEFCGRYWLLRRFAPPRLRSCTCDSTSTLWMKP